MKRKGNLYQQICSVDNLRLAAAIAQKGKRKQPGVIEFNKNAEENILKLHEMLINKTFKTSPYKTFTIYEPKERIISCLPFFPDRIVHHAVMNILEPIFVSTFTGDTYSCIKKRGIHAASGKLKKALKDVTGTQYCLKLDIKKFYPNINHDILKQLLRRKFKDADLLWLLDEIIDSSEGIPIGNYLSQYFANFFLTYFDHWLKETMRVKYYFRYADDMVLLSGSKKELHQLLYFIRIYLKQNLDLDLKENYQVFKVATRGIDFVGYVHFHTHTFLRKSIKQRFCRMLKKYKNPQSVAAYYGWAVHCDSNHLLKKILHEAV